MHAHAHSAAAAAPQFSCLHHIVEWPDTERGGRRKEGRSGGEAREREGALTSEKSSWSVSETTAARRRQRGGVRLTRAPSGRGRGRPGIVREIGRSFGRGGEERERERVKQFHHAMRRRSRGREGRRRRRSYLRCRPPRLCPSVSSSSPLPLFCPLIFNHLPPSLPHLCLRHRDGQRAREGGIEVASGSGAGRAG